MREVELARYKQAAAEQIRLAQGPFMPSWLPWSSSSASSSSEGVQPDVETHLVNPCLPPSSRYSRCINCGAFNSLNGAECERCMWIMLDAKPQVEASHEFIAAQCLPMVISPRVDAAHRAREHQDLLRFQRQLYQLQLPSYELPRKQERPMGYASRFAGPQPLPWVPPRTPHPRYRTPRSVSLGSPPPAPALAPETAAHTTEPRPKSPFSLERSIWAPRRQRSDGRSFYDDEPLLRRAMQCDFERALGSGGLAALLRKDYSDGGARPSSGRPSLSSMERRSSETLAPAQAEAEVAEVREALVVMASDFL